jgi:hypothetical protein
MSKFTLGKLHSKYHILDILSYSLPRQEAVSMLQQLSRSFRLLLNENLPTITKLLAPPPDAVHLSCLSSGKAIISNMAAGAMDQAPLKIEVSIGFTRASRGYLELLAARAKERAERGVKVKRKDRIKIEINGLEEEEISEELISIMKDITKVCEVGIHSKTEMES